jgi:hypothetical protein
VDDHLGLNRSDAEDLASDPERFMKMGEVDVEYGAPWSDLVDLASDMNDLIELASIAGRVGLCYTGVSLLMRCSHLYLIAKATKEHLEGADGDAEGSLEFGDFFREISALAEDLAADLDERYAHLVGTYASDLAREAVYRDVDKRRVATALERAANSRQRAARARGDIGPMMS